MKKSIVSIIIPSRDGDRNGNVQKIINSLKEQKHSCIEIIIVIGVKNASMSRNIGAKIAQGEYLCFIDDDITINSKELINDLVTTLNENRGVYGIIGPSQIIPKESTFFQKEVARTFPRAQQLIVDDLEESDMVTTACLMIEKDLFDNINGFKEGLIAGEDNDLRDRVREIGYKVGLVPNHFVNHPMPKNLKALWFQNEWYGRGRTYIEPIKAQRKLNLFLLSIVKLFLGTIRDILIILFLLKPLLFLGRIANRIGVVKETIKPTKIIKSVDKNSKLILIDVKNKISRESYLKEKFNGQGL